MTAEEIVLETAIAAMDAGKRAERELIERVAKNGISNAIKWAEESVVAAERAALWETVAGPVIDGILDRLQGVRDEAQRQMVRDVIHERSSSALARAVAESKATATARFIDDADQLLAFAARDAA